MVDGLHNNRKKRKKKKRKSVLKRLHEKQMEVAKREKRVPYQDLPQFMQEHEIERKPNNKKDLCCTQEKCGIVLILMTHASCPRLYIVIYCAIYQGRLFMDFVYEKRVILALAFLFDRSTRLSSDQRARAASYPSRTAVRALPALTAQPTTFTLSQYFFAVSSRGLYAL